MSYTVASARSRGLGNIAATRSQAGDLAVTIHLVNGTHAESVGTSKTQISSAAELHVTQASLTNKCGASVSTLVGGLHYQTIAGDLVVSAPTINLVGAVGVFRAAGSEIKLGGAPVVIKGSKIAIKAPLVVKMSGSLKLGPG